MRIKSAPALPLIKAPHRIRVDERACGGNHCLNIMSLALGSVMVTY